MLSPYGVLTLPENRLKTVSMFMGASERKAFQEGKIDLLPNHFSNVPDLLKEITRNHAVLAVVSPMDEKGYFSLGTNSDYVYEMSKTARTVLLEVNEYMPRTYGENQIHISDVTALVENHRPLPESPEMRISEKDEKIAGFVADLIQNGDTLQIGFGSIPGAIMNFLTGHRRLSIHTEMIPEQVVNLYEAGSITNENNVYKPGKLTATFAYGTRKLYDFLHENHDVYMLPVHKTNQAAELSRFKNLVTINATVEVDFLGQCNSEMIAGTYWSSSGGQADFQIGSRLAESSKGILCTHSTAKQDTISRIVPALKPGTPVTTSKNDVDYIITEYGVARLRGKTVRERTRALISIAHPKFREELTFHAKKMGYLL